MVECGSREVVGRAFPLVVACWSALGHLDLPGGEGRGGKACRGQALELLLVDEGLATENQKGQEGRGGMGFTREKSEGTLWWAALNAEGRWGES